MRTMLSIEEFLDRFKPISNHIDPNARCSGWLYEPIDDEGELLSFMSEKHPSRVWRVDEDEDGHYRVCSGPGTGNRGYILTYIDAPEDEAIEVVFPAEVGGQSVFCPEN